MQTSRTYPKVEEWPTHARKAEYSCKLLATRFAVSGRQLERIFLQRFNVSPKHWLREQRMNTAADLLKQGLPIKVVAAELHFRAADTFCRAFKKHFGQTPDSFRVHVASGKGEEVEFTTVALLASSTSSRRTEISSP
jgi:transcriptional regulator GlxA family with amidase domain